MTGSAIKAYFDNSATTRPLDEVIAHMSWVSHEIFGNPSSLHSLGMEAEKLLIKSRKAAARALEADPGCICFTSGGTEANHIALQGYLAANRRKGRKVLFSSVEHPSVLNQAGMLGALGYQVEFIRSGIDGKILTDHLDALLDSDTALVSVMSVNNETGAIQPLDEIADCCRRKNTQTVLHVDAVQSFGKIPVKPQQQGIQLLTASGHKIHGPKGSGLLYIAEGIHVSPLMAGGGQESGIRPGTENVPALSGMGMAIEKAMEGIRLAYRHVDGLHRRIRDEVSCIPGCIIISPEDASPYILSISFPALKAEVILHKLESRGIFVSTGSACHSRRKNRSHVLQAMGLKPAVIDGTIRISLSYMNTLEEAAELVSALKTICGGK
ncbi:MAG TPA: cysteine desulfurase NifS [Clostridiales bacterium]|nr:cysteine desulfurase NifS [Clostridiales bacterium]